MSHARHPSPRAATLAALLGLAACGGAAHDPTPQHADPVIAAALAEEGAGKADGVLDMTVSDWWWCGADGAGKTRRSLMFGARNYYMTTDRLDRKVRFAVDPRHGSPVVAIEASVYLRHCTSWREPAAGEDFPECTAFGPWTWEPVKLKVGHGSVELDLGCLAMGSGIAQVYKTSNGQTFYKIRVEQGFDGRAGPTFFELQSTCDWSPAADVAVDYCFAQPESADPITCDRQQVYEIDGRYSRFLLDGELSKALYLQSLAPWRETAAPEVSIAARVRVRPCSSSRPGEELPECVRYGQAVWRAIGEPVAGEQSISLDLASRAMGSGLDQVYREGLNPVWLVTYEVSEPGRYRVQTACPF